MICAAPNCFEAGEPFACRLHWQILPWHTRNGIRLALRRLDDPLDEKPRPARESDLEDARIAALEYWSLSR